MRDPGLVINRSLMTDWSARFASIYLEKRPPFSKHVLPPEQKHFPVELPRGGIEQANFLGFSGWMQRNGMDGEQLAMNAGKLAVEQPWIIDSRHPKSQDRSAFEALYKFVPYSSRDNKYQPVDMWFNTLQIIRGRYDGDWRNLFLTLPQNGDVMQEREALIKRLDDLPGVGHKIAQLTIQWFQEFSWQDDERWNEIRRIPSLAVDLWIMRLVWQFQFYTAFRTDQHTAISRKISDDFCAICKENDISHYALGQTMWHIGAVICRRRPRADHLKMRQYCKAHCPAYEICQGVVPANYSKERRQTSASGRLASMRWGEMKLHKLRVIDDLGDMEPSFNVPEFRPRVRDFGMFAREKARIARRDAAAATQIKLGLEFPVKQRLKKTGGT